MFPVAESDPINSSTTKHDFSNWKDHDAFEDAFAEMLRNLRAQAQQG
jgi:hypothetical protein